MYCQVLFVLVAVIGKEALEIYLIDILLVLFKAYRAQKIVIGIFAYKKRLVDTAKIYEIKSASSHNEKRFKIVCACDGGQIVYHTALIGELELTNSRQLVINRCGVSQKLGVKFYVAFFAYLLLESFRLNR